MRIEYRAEFRCTPEQLWPFLDDPEKTKQWLTTLVDIVPTSRHERTVGTTFDMLVREARGISRYEGRINAYDVPRHLGVSFWGGNLPRGAVMRVYYRLADLHGTTRLEYYADLNTDVIRGPTKLAIPVARVFTFFQIRYLFRNLSRAVEAAAGQSGSGSIKRPKL